MHGSIQPTCSKYNIRKPYGLSAGFKAKFQEQVILPVRDIEIVKKEDLFFDQEGGPVPFAYPIHVSYTIENMGMWQQLDDGSKIWQLKIRVPGALATFTRYDKFWLPEGGKFFVYSEETKQSIGALTSDFIEGSRESPMDFTTALIYGENIVYEYYQPASVKDLPIISINSIDYAYRHVNNPYSIGLRNFGDSDSRCQVNINCSEGNNWQAEKHAVARVIIPKGNKSFYCSCALVNNTSRDHTAYILTADHCLVRDDTRIRYYDVEGSSSANPYASSNANGMIFFWEYEHPGCANSTIEPLLRTSTGSATIVANNPISDFALIRIDAPSQNPRNIPGVIPYYLGWDCSGNPGAGGVGIHHPSGDVKKISTYGETPRSNGNYWLFNWKSTVNGFSVTQRGSSGSPLINNNRKVIGQLWGSWDYKCDYPAIDDPEYGKFSVSWTGNGATDPRRKLQPWLDPIRSGVTVLDGSYCNAPIESNIDVTSGLYDANSRTYRAAASCLGAIKFEWKTLSSGWTIRNAEPGTDQTMHDVLITPNSSSAPSTSLAVRAYNNCGWCEWILVDRVSYNLTYSISTAPNPASSILNVNITVNEPLQEQYSSVVEGIGIQRLSTINIGSSGTIEMPTSFIIRLYSSFGALALQTTSSADNSNIQLDVSKLPSGVYFLQVLDGAGGEPQTSTVVVKH